MCGSAACKTPEWQFHQTHDANHQTHDANTVVNENQIPDSMIRAENRFHETPLNAS
jgi:hypothetical protein